MDVPYHHVTTSGDLDVLARRWADAAAYGLDTEFYGPTIYDPFARKKRNRHFLDPFRTQLAGYSVALPDGYRAYVPLRHVDGHNADLGPALGMLQAALRRRGVPVWAHFVKGELRILANEGIDPSHAEWRDSMILGWLLGKWVGSKKRLGLKPLVAEHLGVTATTFEDVAGEAVNAIHTVPARTVGPYAAADAAHTLALGQLWEPEARATGCWKAFVDLEMPLVPVLRHCEDVGVPVDGPYLDEAVRSLTVLVGALEEAWWDLVGVEIGRAAACAEVLYSQRAWWPVRGLKRLAASGAWPMDATTLEGLQGRVAGPGAEALDLRLRWAAAAKLLGTYVSRLRVQAGWYPDGRIRPSWNQTSVDTGRLSCSNPNLQNQPGTLDDLPTLRRAFRARPGYLLVVADQSQLEPRVLAHLSGDAALAATWGPDGTGDVYAAVAGDLGITRKAAKVVFLAVMYGKAHWSLARDLSITEDEAQAILDRFWAKYPDVARWRSDQVREARTTGRVRTLCGRFRTLDLSLPTWRVANQAANTPIQGSAADLMKLVMIRLYRRWTERGWLADGTAAILAQVHDELVTEVREEWCAAAAADLQDAMEHAWPRGLRVRLVAKPMVVTSWDQAK